jgi:hypothetical protein
MSHKLAPGQDFEPRTALHDMALLYLFSFDVEVNTDRQNIGFVPGGVRINISARHQLSPAYQILRDPTVPGLGVKTISGSLLLGGDWSYWREDDVELSQVRLVIVTDDDQTIHANYPAVIGLGPGGFRRRVSGKGKIGSEDEPVEFPLVTTPRFETASAVYSWINELQCVGFGVVELVKSELRRITYDIYALT